MATVGNVYLDLIDMVKMMGEKGVEIGAIIDLMKEYNPILEDAVVVECNKGTEHQTSMLTGLPSVAWGQLYKGLKQSKSQRQQVTDTTGFVEGLSSIDERLLNMYSGDRAAAARLGEAMGFIEAMNQEMSTGMFYHDTATHPDKFKGISARYSKIGGSGAGNQIVDAGGTGSDNCSVWFVTWGERFTHLLYPEGMMAGLDRKDMGRQRILDSNGDPFFVKEEMFTWHIGMSVKDWRYNSRVANIDVSQLEADPTNIKNVSGTAKKTSIYDVMRKGYYKLHSRRTRGNSMHGRQVIYCPKNVLEALDELGTNSGGADNFVRLRPMEIEGKEVLTYRGIPIRECDAMLTTEGQVTS